MSEQAGQRWKSRNYLELSPVDDCMIQQVGKLHGQLELLLDGWSQLLSRGLPFMRNFDRLSLVFKWH